MKNYSDSMKDLLRNGYKAKKRPSGHDISERFNVDHGASIPPNLIALANTESNSYYLRYCADRGIKPHPAHYPAGIPEFFIRMLTDPGNFVVDPFAGSCVTGEVAERTKRERLCIETAEEYLTGALGRFEKNPNGTNRKSKNKNAYYKIPRPGLFWTEESDTPLAEDGGRKRSLENKERKHDHKRSKQLALNLNSHD